MKLSAALAFSALFASSALAGPVLRVRQDNNNDDDVLSSPTNGTQLTPGGTLSLNFRTSDDDSTAVRVALVQITEIARDIPVTSGAVTQDITLPADLPAGTYFIGISERARRNSEEDDDDDDDDDDDNDSNNSPSGTTNTTGRYDDYDFSFETPNNSDETRIYVTIGASNSTA